MDVITLTALAALVVKVVSVVKSLGKDNNAVLTQVLTWGVGVAALLLAGHSHFGHDIAFSGINASSMNFADAVLAGMSLSSVGSFAYDVKKAVDNTDSASEPALLKK